MLARIVLIGAVVAALFGAVPAYADESHDPVWCLLHWSHC